MIFRPFIAALACLVTVSTGRVVAASSENPDLSIRFTGETIELSGRVESEETAQILALAASGARPDLQVVNEGLVVDPGATLPPISDLRSVIAELGLSTHDGRFEIWPDRILIGGLTDSVVTLTALRIRLMPILGKRRFINHICIVGTEYLPKIEVSLTTGGPGADLSPIDLTPAREVAFEIPGLLVEKLFPTLLMLSDFDRLEGKTSAPTGTLRAMPLEVTSAETDGLSPAGPASGTTSPLLAGMVAVLPAATPVQQYETLPPVLFSRNSFLLQANQEAVFVELTRYLLSPDREGRAVVIEAVKPSGGSSAFNDYLGERRSAEVVRFLTERGVNAAVLKPGVIESLSPIDAGEVRVKIEIPLLPAEPPAPEEGAEAAKMEPESATPAPAPAPAPATDSGETPETPPGGLKPFSAE